MTYAVRLVVYSLAFPYIYKSPSTTSHFFPPFFSAYHPTIPRATKLVCLPSRALNSCAHGAFTPLFFITSNSVLTVEIRTGTYLLGSFSEPHGLHVCTDGECPLLSTVHAEMVLSLRSDFRILFVR